MQISAFVDGELPENEAELLLRRLSQDAELRQEVAEFLALGRLIRSEAGLSGADRMHERISAEINERAEKAHLITARDLAESRRLARDLDKDERRRLFLVQRSHDAALSRGAIPQDSTSSVD